MPVETTVTVQHDFMHPDLAPLLHSIFVTACEGGIGYWCDLSVYRWSRVSPADLAMPDYDGFCAKGTDVDDPEDVFEIDRVTIARGCARICDLTRTIGNFHSDGQRRLASILLACAAAPSFADGTDLDAEDADFITQVGLFGEIVYG